MMNKARLKDLLVIASCLSVAAISLNAFRLDLFQTIASNNLEPVGSVIFRNNNVQRRFGDRVLWGRLFTESPLYIGDLIRVAEFSNAKLIIEDNEITLSENTLIRILRSSSRDGNIVINLGMGSLNVISGRGIELNIVNNDDLEADTEAEPESILIVHANPQTELVVTAVDNTVSVSITEGNAAVVLDGARREEARRDEARRDRTPRDRPQRNRPQPSRALSAGSYLSFNPQDEEEMQELFELIVYEAQEVSILQELEVVPDTPPQEETQIAVSAVQLLPIPANRLPVNGNRVSIEDLRRTRRIDFSWQAVPGANAYIFILSHQSSAGQRQVIQTELLTVTGWSLTDLSLLDQGTFIWQAEAVALNNDGTIGQRGRVSENTFVIDIPEIIYGD